MRLNSTFIVASLALLAGQAHATPDAASAASHLKLPPALATPLPNAHQAHLENVQALFKVSYATKPAESAGSGEQSGAFGAGLLAEKSKDATNVMSFTAITSGTQAVMVKNVQELSYVAQMVDGISVPAKLQFGKTFTLEPIRRDGKYLTVRLKGTVTDLLALESHHVLAQGAEASDGVQPGEGPTALRYATIELPRVAYQSFDETVVLAEGEGLALRGWNEGGQDHIVSLTLEKLDVKR